eukprot:gene5546-5782_t
MQWFVKEGDVVEEFQPICEVQSDKAAIEITSRSVAAGLWSSLYVFCPGTSVQGTGPRGRILKEDVERHKKRLVSSIADKLVDRMAEKTGPASAAELYTAAAGDGARHTGDMADRVEAMIKSALEASHIPTFHYMDEINVDALLAVRYPGLNVSLEPGGAALLQHHSHNIGIAMATSNGLVVPNIKKLVAVQQTWQTGGTVGGTTATPMLNPPEVAIVALGRVQALPRYVTSHDGHAEQLVKQHIMSVSWGGDHRVVDGAAIAEFSNFWKHLLEQPSRLLMHMK